MKHLGPVHQHVAAQQVDGQRREGDKQDRQVKQWQKGQGKKQSEEIVKVTLVEDEPPGSLPDHGQGYLERIVAPIFVVGEVLGFALGVGPGDHNVDRHVEPDPRRDDHGCPKLLPLAQKDSIQAHQHYQERHLFFAAHGQYGEDNKPRVLLFLQGVKGPEQKGGGQGHGVEVVQVGCFERWGEQIRRRENDPPKLTLQLLPRQQIERPGPDGDDDRLEDEQSLGAAVDQIEQRNWQKDGFHMLGQPDGQPLHVGETEEATMDRVPDGLIIVAQIVGQSFESVVASH